MILDKRLSKKTKHILFLKIDNDGFGLGAQRREIESNDLPLALETILDYKLRIGNNEPIGELPGLATLVEKSLVLNNKDIVLSADRYFINELTSSDYKLAKIGDIAELGGGGTPSKENPEFWEGGTIDWITCSDFSSNEMFLKDSIRKITEKGLNESSSRLVSPGTLILVTRVSLGKMAFVVKQTAINQDLTAVVFNEKLINKFFGYYCLKSITDLIISTGHGATVKGVSREFVKEIEIPLPPLDIQQQIVTEIEAYQKIIDGAKQIVNNYKPTISIKPEWEMVELGKISKLIGGSTPSIANPLFWDNGTIDWITCSDFSQNDMYLKDSIRKITEKAVKESSTNIVPAYTLIMVTRVSLGKFAFVTKPTAINQDLTALIVDESKTDKKYIYLYLLSISDRIVNEGHGATVKGVTRDYVKEIPVPLPSLEEQTIIVQRIEEEQSLVNSNKRLIEIFEQKIKNKINEVWGVKDEKKYAVPNDELLIGVEDFD